MIRKMTFLYFAILLISCGKDVVIIEDPIIPNETDELFEVNLVGFITNHDRAFIPNNKVEIEGVTNMSDEYGFFDFDKVLIGKKGKVVKVQNDGYLPSYYRMVNHQSLEQIMSNLRLIEAPNPISISESGGTIEDNGGRLIIDNQDINADSDFIFKTFMGQISNDGNSDQLYLGSQTEFLLKEVSFYVSGSSPLNTNSELEISLGVEDFYNNDISELSIFYFDEEELSWKQHNVVPSKSGGNISFSLNRYGWWTIAEKVPAQYGTINLTQINDTEINSAEVEISYENESYAGPTFYTSTSGSISTYFPSEKTITASLNNKKYSSDLQSGFSSGVSDVTIHFQEEVQTSFESKVYDCDFTFFDGYVALLSQGQQKLLAIENGIFKGETFSDDNEITLRFYTNEYIFSNNKDSNIEALKNENVSFFSCVDLEDKLVVTDGTNLLQDFDNCRIKEAPNETIVIGERGNGDVFLVSFEGEKEGVYDGLFYFPEILDDVKSDVVVNIVLYDKVENKVGGFIKTEYISTGDELSISFIGDIE